MRKYLILDKSVLEATLTCKLEQFVQNHFLILPNVLYYECITTEKNQEELLERFRSVILAGGYTSPSCKDIIQNEARNLCPYGFLVDLKAYPAVVETFRKDNKPYNSNHVEAIHQDELDMAKMLRDSAEDYLKRIASEEPKLLSAIRKFDNSRKGQFERFQTWIENIDSQDIHLASTKQLKGITNCHNKYCLSDKWLSWQFLRLTHVIFMEHAFLRQTGSASKTESFEHDLQDVKYVILLSRTDGLLTGDAGCSCLAQAAFPEKDVFTSLDEVPEEYICNWS